MQCQPWHSGLAPRSYPNPNVSPGDHLDLDPRSCCWSQLSPCSPSPTMDHPTSLMEPDAGRRSFGAQRHRRENGPPTSPTRSPYPLPYYHLRNKIHLKSLDGRDPESSITTDERDEPLASSSSRHLRHSVPDITSKHGPRFQPSSSPSSLFTHNGAIHGARARFVSLPAVVSSFPRIDTECDRLERACGRTPTALLRVRDDQPPSSPHQPRGDGPPPPLVPKCSHWELVLRIKRALRRDGKDIRDYLEAGQINDLYHRDVDERARRERERGRMARIRAGQEPSQTDESTRSSHLPYLAHPSRRMTMLADIFGIPLSESVLRAPATAILGGHRHDLPLVVFLCVEELYRTGEHRISKYPFFVSRRVLPLRHLQERPFPRSPQSPTTSRIKHLVRYPTCLWRGHEPACRIDRGYLRTPLYLPQGTPRTRLDALPLQCLLELVCPTQRET